MVGSKAKRYAFHMKAGMPTIEGLLIKRTRTSFIVISAQILEAEDRSHTLAGHVEILRENVYVMQEIE